MSFITDKQTLDDLNIFGARGRNNIYALYNKTITRGGARVLEEMFRFPLNSAAAIMQRTNAIGYFTENPVVFPYKNEWFDAAEHYLSNTDARSHMEIAPQDIKRRFYKLIGADTQYEQIQKGAIAIAGILRETARFADARLTSASGKSVGLFGDMRKIVSEPQFVKLAAEQPPRKLTPEQIGNFDKLFRGENSALLKKLFYLIYTLDVFISVAHLAKERRFAIPQISSGDGEIIQISALRHPLVESPVPNDVTIDTDSNIVFLTGANMAGKSTLMKALGVAVFLAHIGFPVAADGMRFSVRNGMYTTINLPDNLSLGYSHFYAEVLRLKKVARQSGRVGRLVIIFDELFRGTNVKDAYDATLAVTAAFARNPHCVFIISTHITEVGEALRPVCGNCRFVYLPTEVSGEKTTYTYKLKEGITDDRHGMMIINNERIIRMLEEGAESVPPKTISRQ